MQRVRPAIPKAIWTLGFVSLFSDMSSEMVHGLLPVLLAGGLGASALIIGLIEGAAEALVLVVKVFSGYISDALGRRKPLLLFGYGLATAVKPLFPLAGSVATVTTARLLDRFGKGIRGAPRDALVGDLAPPEMRGAAFGLRQSLDTVGAIVGPLIAVGLMWLLAGDIQAVLWWAVVPGILAVTLLIRLPEPHHEHRPARLPLTREGLSRLGPALVRLTVLGALFSLARFSEAFLVLRAMDIGLPATYAPLVLVVMSVIYALTAWPAGHLSDRLPRALLLGIGMLALAAADVALALAYDVTGLFIGVALWGLHMGLTQGIVASMVADVAPPAHRGTAFGVFNLISGLALLAASITAGWLWDLHGPASTFWLGAALSILTFLLVPLLSVGARLKP